MVRSRSFLLPLCLGWPLLEEDALELALELEVGRDDCLELATLPLPVFEGALLPAPSELVLLRGDAPVQGEERYMYTSSIIKVRAMTLCVSTYLV
jgi:hypothetical protein